MSFCSWHIVVISQSRTLVSCFRIVGQNSMHLVDKPEVLVAPFHCTENLGKLSGFLQQHWFTFIFVHLWKWSSSHT